LTGETVTTRRAIIGVAGGKGACDAKDVLSGDQAIVAIGAIGAIWAIRAIGVRMQGAGGTGQPMVGTG